MRSKQIIQCAILMGCVLLLLSAFPSKVQAQKHFQFKSNKTFRIAQFSDIHWDNNSENCPRTIAVIKNVLKTERPDLAVLTGDIVTASPAEAGWKAIAQPFIDSKTPWAVVLGNHDGEPGPSRDEIFELLTTLPYFAGEKGPELYGCGNYDIPVWSSDNKKVESVLYCIDSNDNTTIIHKDYDWIHFDQINWYRETSKKYTLQNNNRPLPSLAFFHIPIPEYKEVVGQPSTVGIKNEGVASSHVNSGIFASFLDMKDVMGVFVGHDHDNNYIGIHDNIALAFSEVTGYDTYGDLDRGARIIELKEGEYSFDTWIRTDKGVSFKYNYPAGLKYDDKDTDYSPAVEVNELTPGVRYSYFEGNYSSAKDLESAKEIKSGTLENISIAPADQKDHFGFEFDSYLKIDKKGVYLFYLYSDDGAILYIDGKPVVDNDGSHSARRSDGRIGLEKGYHELKLVYFEDYEGQQLEVGISGLTIRETTIPNDMLFIKN